MALLFSLTIVVGRHIVAQAFRRNHESCTRLTWNRIASLRSVGANAGRNCDRTVSHAARFQSQKPIQNDIATKWDLKSPPAGARILLELNPDGASAIALKINASAVQCALTNLLGEVLWYDLVALDTTQVDYVLDICEQLINCAFDKNRERRSVVGIGVVVTGVIGADGRVVYSKYMNWKDVDLRACWERKFGVKVSVDNEVNGATVGENHYEARFKKELLYIEWSWPGWRHVIEGSFIAVPAVPPRDRILTILCERGMGVLREEWQSLVSISSYMNIARREIRRRESETDSQSLTLDDC